MDGEHDVPGNVVYLRGEVKPSATRRLDMNISDAVASPKDDGVRRQLLVLAKSISMESPIHALLMGQTMNKHDSPVGGACPRS